MTNLLTEFEQTPKSSIFKNNITLGRVVYLFFGISSLILFFWGTFFENIPKNDFAIAMNTSMFFGIGMLLQLIFDKTIIPTVLALLWLITWLGVAWYSTF